MVYLVVKVDGASTTPKFGGNKKHDCKLHHVIQLRTSPPGSEARAALTLRLLVGSQNAPLYNHGWWSWIVKDFKGDDTCWWKKSQTTTSKCAKACTLMG